jgi:putative tryptophan/tyrosine transport system substrate-binding protein
MNRRDLMAMLGGVAATWPRCVSAQSEMRPWLARADDKASTIGILSSQNESFDAPYLAAFRKGLSEVGFGEGQNLTIEYRWSDGHNDQLRTLAEGLVAMRVVAIAAMGSAAVAMAAKAATTNIPIVFATGGDPLTLGLVSRINRPEGNVTGVSFFLDPLGAKRMELLRELLPNVTSIALLVNPTNPSAGSNIRDAQRAAGALGLKVDILKVSNEEDINAAFAFPAGEQPDALIVDADAFFSSRRDRLVVLAAMKMIPAIYSLRGYVEAGGLISYGTSVTDAYRAAGVYMGRVLGGLKPADLPVMQASKFELVINLKTAKALGLTIPPTLLARADEVIE